MMKEKPISLEKEIDSYIQELAVAVTQHQGLHFQSLKEADNHAEKTSEEIRQLFQQSKVIVKEGLNHLTEKSTGFVADTSKKLLEHFDVPEELVKIIQTEIQENPNALQLFSEAVNSFYGCGDFHTEQCVISVFMMFFPMYPQPYACYATLIWRKEGIEAAQAFYEQIVSAMEDPVLDYFAADCFVKAGNPAKGKKLLERALGKVSVTAPGQADLRQHILDLQRRCS